jgi:V8-like Glu-specific endopeptidase
MTVVGSVLAVIGTLLAIEPADATGATASPRPSAPATMRHWTALAAKEFWSVQRMAEAKPLPDAKPAASPDIRPRSAPGAGPSSTYFPGLPTVGRMYMQTKSGYYFCTASVINSPHRDIVLTAGHCMDTKAGAGSMAFVPQWTAANPQPFGIFPVATDAEGRSQVWLDPRYYDLGRVRGDQWDVAFAQVGPRADGKQVQDVVGGDNLATGRGYAFSDVRLVGYPGNDPQPLTCTSSTTQFTPTDGTPGSFLRIACAGFRTGTSGSPFLADFDPQTGTGDVVGSIGGWDTGGPTSDVSYSSYYGPDVQNLYDAAVAGTPPARPNVLPGASTLTGATLMTAGYFTPSPAPDGDLSDLIVRWSDGALTLYRGAGGGRFDKAVQLAKAGSAWTKAVAITAGDFTGTSTYDLMVRWSDGSLTLYPDVDARGLHSQITLVRPNAQWQRVAAITAGRFTTDDHWPDDLIVRWVDGALTLYKNVDTRDFGRTAMVQLARANSTWAQAGSIASGDFTQGRTDDLLVRSADGGLTLYPHVDEHGLHGAVSERAPSALWTHATVTAAGDFAAADGLRDDYLVRWSDGQLSLYSGTGRTLGTESVPVAATGSALPPVRR